MVLTLGEWLAIPVCLAGFVLFYGYGAGITPNDSSARPHARETIGFCAMGLLLVGTVMLAETNARAVIQLGLVGGIFAIIGGRLFLDQRRRAGPTLD